MSIDCFNNKLSIKQDRNIPNIVEIALFIDQIKSSIWLFGIPSWLFGITDRSIAALVDGYLSTIEIFQLFTAFFFFVSWLYLKPEESFNSNDLEPSQYQEYLDRTQANKLQLKKLHMISQEYILPFPYICQIYHLLNLKHLETIHRFSLNNLKILSISQFQPTNVGGRITFQTILDSPANPLRIWRQPIVEVDLILHTPYAVELSIPIYNNKRIIVIFHAFPLNDSEHQLFIDIYSDLEWPKPLLQIILHFASCLTLFEDLPYLRALTDKNIDRLFNLSRTSNHESALLFKRFVELYASSGETTKLLEGSKES
ncbi:hypothetical protein [Nostoc sp. 'Peltigera malacea cyanobiont' DB3992]|uniref:hypothetical protein n=1 Tax=Nostoc sp. 'Peltigera malacea cyanobiont' DB3992 TaxID=1206980 RepID=UPI000C04AFCD|nr:hypothetical protein [Nostoc sp. 'Peltigera malacea cyanobiont' DB3992]PHM06803.1 hypothetical protein CK516_31085 [Nostoc sp. 'Peltigera malacea cyanobiont' DB3992]